MNDTEEGSTIRRFLERSSRLAQVPRLDWGLGFGVWSLGFRVQGSVMRVEGFWCRAQSRGTKPPELVRKKNAGHGN